MERPTEGTKWYLDSRKWALIGCAVVLLFAIVLIIAMLYSVSLPGSAPKEVGPGP